MRTRRVWRPPALLLVLCAALASVRSATAEEPTGPYVFRTFAEEEGYANPVPEVLLQDRAGFLWIGATDGLYRFDGRAFARFGTAEGLPSPWITALHETKDGRFYAGTRSGLARLDGLGFRPLGPAAGLPASPVAAIASDDSGALWIATTKGLFLSISERFNVEARKDGPERPITALAVEPGGVVYFARDGLVFRRESGNVAEWGSARGLPPLERVDTLALGGGRLWVRTISGLASIPLEGGNGRFAAEDRGLPPAAAWGRLAFGADGTPIVPTARGLAERRGNAWRLLTRREGLPSDVVLAALVDREGSLWLSLAGVGLATRPGRGDVTAFGRQQGLAGDSVRAITRERSGGSSRPGALWVGTEDGLTRLSADGSGWTLQERDGLGGNGVFALAPAEDGGVWAGLWPGGVTRIGADRRLRRYGAAGAPPAEMHVLALRARRDGDLWAGTANGVYRLAPGASSFERVEVPGGEEPDTVYAFVEDRSGALFAAGRFGLSRVSPSPRRFRKKNGLKGDFIVSAVADELGFVLAYRDVRGLERVAVDGDRLLISPFAPAKARVPERAAFVGRDAGGAIWVGSSGVDVYRNEGGEPAHVGRSEGLPADELNLNAFFDDPDGTVWIGTKRGLGRRAPGPLAAPRPAPPVAFTTVVAGSRALAPDRAASLSAKERSLRVAWAGLGFADARRLRYRYRLEPVDDTDTETSISEVTLKGLSPGRYTLAVAAVSPEGAAGKPSSFAFRVAPAWWQGLPARLLFLALGVAFVLWLVAFRTRKLRAENARLADAVETREATLHAKERELAEASLTDELTGLKNRRFFFAIIPGEIDRATRAHGPLATPAERRSGDILFYLVEVDSLKEVNERFGNVAGDSVLVESVRRLKGVVRSSDYLVHWGGTVFLVMTRSTGRDQGNILAQRVLDAFAVSPFTVDGAELPRTCSIGWAPFPWAAEAPEVVPYEDVLRFADRALEAAKRGGRNRAVGAVAAMRRGDSASVIEGLESVPLRVVETFGPVGRVPGGTEEAEPPA